LGESATLVLGYALMLGLKSGTAHPVGASLTSVASAPVAGCAQVVKLKGFTSGPAQELGNLKKGRVVVSSAGQPARGATAHRPRIGSWLASAGTPQIVTLEAVTRLASVMLSR